MSKEQALSILEATKSEQEWNNAIDHQIKPAFGGYPEWWFFEVVMSGFAHRVSSQWTK